MLWQCSRGVRCKAPTAPLSERHFRTGHTIRKQCAFCRNKASNLPVTPIRAREQTCSTCGWQFRTPNFRDSRGRLRQQCESCILPQNSSTQTTPGHQHSPPARSPSPTTGLTPRSARAQPRARTREPSPSPYRPQPEELHLQPRARRVPQRFLPTPSPPAVPGNQPRPALARNPNRSKCARCRKLLDNNEYDQDGQGRRFLTCRTCLEYVNRRAQRRGSPSSSSSTPSPSSTHTFFPVSVNEHDYDNNCMSEEAISHIKHFYDELGKDKMETCLGCNERWFGMKVSNGRCHRCLKGEHEQRYGANNDMDPGKRHCRN